MGFYIRKSFGKGPIRLNLSKSGLGISVGVKGARVSFGPRGTYLHAGRGGLYYRQRLVPPLGGRAPGAAPRAARGSRPMAGPLHAVGSADFSALLASSPSALAHCLNRRAQAGPYAPLVGGLLYVLSVLIGTTLAQFGPNSGAPAVTVILLLVSTVVTAWVTQNDRRRRTTLLEYRLPPEAARRFVTLQRALVALAGSQAIWRVTGQQAIWNSKWQASAEHAIERYPVSLRPGVPPHIQTNLQVQCLDLGDLKLCFFPDQVIVHQRGRYATLAYDAITLAVGGVPFVEFGPLPADARVMETRWQHMNKDGSPDLRFAQNRQVPVAGYATLTLYSPNGLDVRLMLSGVAAVSQCLQRLQTMPAPRFRIVHAS